MFAQASELCISETSNHDEALRRAIKAAELYMRAMEVTTGGHEKARLKKKCETLLRRAESLKKAAQGLKAPVSTRSFTTKEQVILLEGSKLNGFVFRMWESDPDPEEFRLRDGEELFTYGRTSNFYFYTTP
jgi:calpain-7